MSVVPDVARIRFQNAMRLFDEFVQAAIKTPDAATLRGLERRFAERLHIQPSYWSQIKAGSRQIGERLARQFEQLCRKPVGWMDQVHQGPAGVMAAPMPAPKAGAPASAGAASGAGASDAHRDHGPAPLHQPQDDDERFIVGLVLTYYRRHPAKARTRLLDLLGEVLVPPPPALPQAPAPKPAGNGSRQPKATAPLPAPAKAPPKPDDAALWARTQAGIAPLKRKG